MKHFVQLGAGSLSYKTSTLTNRDKALAGSSIPIICCSKRPDNKLLPTSKSSKKRSNFFHRYSIPEQLSSKERANL